MTMQDDDDRRAANKQLVLAMWHDVIDGRNIEAAAKYIAPDYIQHSPGVGQGLAALIAFLRTEFPDAQPLEPGTYPQTRFEFVIAEGDLVQLMFRRTLPRRSMSGGTTLIACATARLWNIGTQLTLRGIPAGASARRSQCASQWHLFAVGRDFPLVAAPALLA